MKKSIVILFLLFFFASNSLYAGQYRSILLEKSSGTEFVISSKTNDGFSAITSIGSVGLSEYQSPEGAFTALEIEGYSKNYGTDGKPHLPVITKLIEVPYGAAVKISNIRYDTEEIFLAESGVGLKIGPMQPSVSKSIPADKVEFHYNASSYKINAFNTAPLVTFKEIGTTRGVRVGRLKITPIRYNPIQNIVKVLNNIRFDVKFENADTVYAERLKKRNYSSVFKNSLSSIEKLPEVFPARKDAISENSGLPVTYVIIAHEDFKGAASLNEFISWKRQLGFNVIDVYTDDPAVGSTKILIKEYLEDLYHNSPIIPSYALLIGDVDKIPSWDGKSGGHVTDLYYFTYDGASDYMPEVYYGRFPADNEYELDSIIAKTLQYENNELSTETDLDYLDNYMFIAGADSEYALSHGNAQVQYAVEEYFPTINKYLYEESRSEIADLIIDNFNSGIGFVNYTGHCTTSSWRIDDSLSDDFNSRDVSELTNKNKYGFVIGNCCLSNQFDNERNKLHGVNDIDVDCFGENIVKQPNGGAVGYIGASNDTFWDEDFFWAVGGKDYRLLTEDNAANHMPSNTGYGAYDGLFHEGKDENEWFISAGQIIYCGNLSVTDIASDFARYYWEIYNLMGDPSLVPYMEAPTPSRTKTSMEASSNSTGSGGGACFIETSGNSF